jgi:hypothetical protein
MPNLWWLSPRHLRGARNPIHSLPGAAHSAPLHAFNFRLHLPVQKTERAIMPQFFSDGRIVENAIALAYLSLKKQSPTSAGSWYEGLLDDIFSLESFPTRCPIASESEEIGKEISQLLPSDKIPLNSVKSDVLSGQ